MAASDLNGTPGVIAVSADNRWAHAYAGRNDALLDESLAKEKGIAFFDVEGHTLVPVNGPDGRLKTLEFGDSPADPDQVRDRLHTILRRVPDVMRQRQQLIAEYLADEERTLEQVLAELPSLEGADLAQTLERYRTILGPHSMQESLQHKGSFFHNVFVHGW